MEPVMLLIGRDAVAEQLVGALACDPVVQPAVRRPAAARTRRLVALALRATADRLAPADRVATAEPVPAGC